MGHFWTTPYITQKCQRVPRCCKISRTTRQSVSRAIKKVWNLPRFASAIFYAIVDVDHVITVQLLQLRRGVVADGNDKTFGIVWLQVAFEDKQSLGICSCSNTSWPECCYNMLLFTSLTLHWRRTWNRLITNILTIFGYHNLLILGVRNIQPANV